MPPTDTPERPDEAHYFSLLDNASEAILSFRAGEGLILEVNAQAERLLGRPRDELIGTPFVEAFAPEHRDPIAWLVLQADGAPLRLEDLAILRPAPPAPTPTREQGASGRPNAEGRGEQQSTFVNSAWQPMPDPFRSPQSDSSPSAAPLFGDGWADAGNGLSGRRGASASRREVPVSLSCNWIHMDGGVVAQAILRDATSARQVRRELESYTVQLEERVAARTRELSQSEERFRALFLQEQRRTQHLSLINDVQQCALGNTDLDDFPHCCARALQRHFKRCDASFFLVDSPHPWSSLDLSPASASTANEKAMARPWSPDDEFDLVCVAQAGGHGLCPAPGTRLSSRAGLAGASARAQEILYRGPDAADAPASPERAPGVYRDAHSETAVPIVLEGRVLGVLNVRSEESLPFDAPEAVALETVANIIASHLHSSRLFREIGELNVFHHTLVNTMLHSLMVVDGRGRLEVVNERLCATLGQSREQLIGQALHQVLGEDVVRGHGLGTVIEEVTLDGTPREVPEVHVRTPEGLAVLDLRIFRVYFRGEPKAVVLAINITIRWRKAHQLQFMHEMGRFFQASLDIDRVLHTVLTCITAGSSLGFNRAFVLLRDNDVLDEGDADGDDLLGAMALGPSSQDEASHIWGELSQRNPTLQELLASTWAPEGKRITLLQHATRGLSFDLNDPALQVLADVVREGRAANVSPCELFPLPEDQGDPRCPTPPAPPSEMTLAIIQAARALFVASEMAIAPLMAKDRVVGVVLADNLYSRTPIKEDDVQLLDILAQQAGLTIDNALTYQALQKAQRGLVSAERLAAVGEMAARVSHEIRNPLATIGGFARSILKRPDEADKVAHKINIIVDEVARLEELLTDLIDMAKPRQLNLEAHSVNEVASHALLLADADIKASGVTVQRQMAPEMPTVLLDRSRLLQAILNIVRNGAQAMADKSRAQDGSEQPSTMTISTRLLGVDENREQPMIEIEVRDEGIGISERAVSRIFDPFFSTKVSGSGLGLAVTRRILQDHGGDIDVQSQENVGTTFYLRFPARLPESASEVAPEAVPESTSEARMENTTGGEEGSTAG